MKSGDPFPMANYSLFGVFLFTDCHSTDAILSSFVFLVFRMSLFCFSVTLCVTSVHLSCMKTLPLSDDVVILSSVGGVSYICTAVPRVRQCRQCNLTLPSVDHVLSSPSSVHRSCSQVMMPFNASGYAQKEDQQLSHPLSTEGRRGVNVALTNKQNIDPQLNRVDRCMLQ